MRIILAIILLSVSLDGIAQDNMSRENKHWANLSLQGIYLNGYVFGTNSFLRGNNAAADRVNAFQAFSLKLSTQTTGQNLWEQIYKYPHYGIGIYAASFDNQKEIGTPVAVYGFFNAPFTQWNRLSFNYELGFGAAFNWNSFNPITNPYNVSIGAGESFFINAGLTLQYKLSDDFDLSSGFYLTHFSNGSLKKPNKGINIIAPMASLKYNFYKPPVFIKRLIPTYRDENEWLVSVFGGLKNVIFGSVNVNVKEKFEGAYFPGFGLSTTFNWQVSRKSKIGIGMTASYNGSVNAQIAGDGNELDAVDRPLGEKIRLSIYPSYELLINKVSIILQPAFYLYRKKLKKTTAGFSSTHWPEVSFHGSVLRRHHPLGLQLPRF